MKRKRLVSVLICAYQSNDTLPAAISSVVRQSYRPNEIIVSDDGTEAFDAGPAERLLQGHGPLLSGSVLSHKENRGTVANLNSALDRATGEWILLLAGDDQLLGQDAVSSMVELAETSGKPWIIPRVSEGKKQYPEPDVCECVASGDAGALYWKLCARCCLPSSGAMYQRALLREMGAFDPQYRLVEDWPLMLRLVRKGVVPAISSECLLLHGTDGVSRSAAGRNRSYQSDLIRVMEQEILPHLPDGDPGQKDRIRRIIRDKQDIYAFRFCCMTASERIGWCFRHVGLIAERVLERMCKES